MKVDLGLFYFRVVEWLPSELAGTEDASFGNPDVARLAPDSPTSPFLAAAL